MDVKWVHSVQLADGEEDNEGDAIIGQRLTERGDARDIILYAAAGPAQGEKTQYVYAVGEYNEVRALQWATLTVF